MRFYFGFSKKIPIKWIIGSILGVLAFFGLTKVHAAEISDLVPNTPAYQGVYNSEKTFQVFYSPNNNPSTNVSFAFDTPYVNSSNAEYLVFYSYGFGYSTSNSYTNSSAGVYNSNEYNFFLANYQFYVIDNTVPATVLCDSKSGYFICPLANGHKYTHAGLRAKLNNSPTLANTTYQLYFNVMANAFLFNSKSSQQNQQIIDNQQHTNDLLSDDNVSDSNNSANGFFGDFEVSDSKGITGVITAPISFLESLITYNPDSCSALVLDLNMSDDNLSQSKTISLPCGSILWSKVPSNILIFYNVLVWGLMGYRVLIGLNKFFNDMVNPESVSEYYLDL